MSGTTVAYVAARLDDLVMSVAELLDVECVGVLLLDSAARLRTVSTGGRAAGGLERAQESAGVGPGPGVQRTGVALAVFDVLAVREYVDLVPYLAGNGVRAVLSAQLHVRDTVIGNLNVVDPVPRGWTDRRQAALLTFAALVTDLLLLSAAGRGEDVAHLTNHLAEPDGACS